jgi:O-antigen/teichoic acid export membrane protein
MNLNAKKLVLPALGISILSSMLAGVVVSRCLGVDSFSAYSKILAISGLAGIAVDAGSTLFGIQETNKERFSQTDLMSTILSFRLVGFSFASVAMFLYLEHAGYGFVPLFLLVLSIGSGVLSQEWLLVASQSTATVYLLRSVPSLSVLLFVLIFRTGDLTALILFRLIGLIVQTTIGLAVSKAVLARPRRVVSFIAVRPIFVNAVFSQIYTSRLDLLILAKTASSASVGSYAVLSNYFSASGSVLSSLMLRNLGRFGAEPKRSPANREGHKLSEFLVFGTGLSLGVLLFSNLATSLTYGRAVMSSTASLGFMAGAVLMSFLGGSFGVRLLALGLNQRVQFVPLVPAVVNLAANLLLTPRLKGQGSALAMLLAESLNVITLLWIWRKVSSAPSGELPFEKPLSYETTSPVLQHSTELRMATKS